MGFGRKLALAGISLLAFGIAVQAGAQPVEMAQTAGEVSFDIAPQSLAGALTAFGLQSGYQVSADQGALAGISSPGVRGRLTPSQALARLLSGTGLVARMLGANSVTVERPVQGSDGAETLPTVVVEAGAQSATTSPAGFAATRSAVGSKTDAPIIEIPQSISVVTRDQMAARAVQTDAEALLYVPGLWAQPFGGTQNQFNPFFNIRGFSSSFGGSYVDGLVSPVNYRYEPYGIERIDVLRGPTSTLYGQSDPGGLVDRISKRPTDQAFGEIQLQAGNFDRYQGAIDLGGPIDDAGQFQYRFTALARDGNAPVEFDVGPDVEDDRIYVAPALTWQPNAQTSLTILASYLEDDVGQESSYLTSPNPFRLEQGYELTRINISQRDQTLDYRQYMVGYLLEHRFSEDLRFRQNVRFAHLNLNYVDLAQEGFATSVPTVIPRYSYGFEETRDDLTVDNQLEVKFATGPVTHRMLAGFDYQHLKDRYAFLDSYSSGEAVPPLDLGNPDYDQDIPGGAAWLAEKGTSSIYGLYLQDQIRLENWILTLGGRQDWDFSESHDFIYGSGTTKAKDDAFTFRAGLTYVSDFGLAPYVSYAESFLPNGANEKPTEGAQYEIGLKYEPTAFTGLFTLALFDLTKQNISYQAQPSQPPVQIGKARSRGVEFQAVANPVEGLTLMAAFSHAKTEVIRDTDTITGNWLPNAPRTMASAWVDYTVPEGPLWGLGFGFGARYVGETYADRQNQLKNDDYTLVDAALRYDLGKAVPSLAGTEVAVNANNLFDEEYTTCFSWFDCKWGPSRTVIGTVTYRW